MQRAYHCFTLPLTLARKKGEEKNKSEKVLLAFTILWSWETQIEIHLSSVYIIIVLGTITFKCSLLTF